MGQLNLSSGESPFQSEIETGESKERANRRGVRSGVLGGVGIHGVLMHEGGVAGLEGTNRQLVVRSFALFRSTKLADRHPWRLPFA
jgi:hypothetical protein